MSGPVRLDSRRTLPRDVPAWTRQFSALDWVLFVEGLERLASWPTHPQAVQDAAADLLHQIHIHTIEQENHA